MKKYILIILIIICISLLFLISKNTIEIRKKETCNEEVKKLFGENTTCWRLQGGNDGINNIEIIYK